MTWLNWTKADEATVVVDAVAVGAACCWNCSCSFSMWDGCDAVAAIILAARLKSELRELMANVTGDAAGALSAGFAGRDLVLETV